jgi:DNA polymerase III gamma/tau subunit
MSRCQRFDFHRISQNDIAGKLKEICDGEGIKIEEEALNVLAKNATGSLRDAENLLEKLSTHYGFDINLNQVRDMLGITGNERIKELVEYIIDADITEGIKTINEINNDGFDLKQLNRELIAYLRGLLLIKTGYNNDIDFTSEETSLLSELSAKTTVEKILKAIKISASWNSILIVTQRCRWNWQWWIVRCRLSKKNQCLRLIQSRRYPISNRKKRYRLLPLLRKRPLKRSLQLLANPLFPLNRKSRYNLIK